MGGRWTVSPRMSVGCHCRRQALDNSRLLQESTLRRDVLARASGHTLSPGARKAMPSRHRSFWSGLVGAAVLLASPLAFAQSTEPGKPCKADLQKLCPGVEPGHGRILACLEGKTDQLSPACKDDVSKKLNAFYKACKPDADKFCATVDRGEGRVMQCLKDNEASLSKACKNVWEGAKGKKKAAAK